MLLVSLVGAGVQLFGMAMITIVIAMLGMLSPASRGALLTASFVFFILMGYAVWFTFGCLKFGYIAGVNLLLELPFSGTVGYFVR